MTPAEKQALLGLFNRFDEIEQIKEQVCSIPHLKVLVSIAEYPDQHMGWHRRQLFQRKSMTVTHRIFQTLEGSGLIARHHPDRRLENGSYYKLTKNGDRRIAMALRLMSADAPDGKKPNKKEVDEDARNTCSC